MDVDGIKIDVFSNVRNFQMNNVDVLTDWAKLFFYIYSKWTDKYVACVPSYDSLNSQHRRWRWDCRRFARKFLSDDQYGFL